MLGFVLLVDLWRLGVPLNRSDDVAAYFPSTRFLRDLQAIPPTERLVVEGEIFPANSALLYGIRDWRAQDAMLSERAYQAALFLFPQLSDSIWTEYNFYLNKIELQAAPILGIRYLVRAIDPDQPSMAGPGGPDRPPMTRLAAKEGLGLWRIEEVPGFSYLSDRVSVAGNEEEAAAWMRGMTWAQVRSYVALVEASADAVAAIRSDPAGSSPGSVEVLTYTPGHIRLRANAQRPSLLVVAESYYPDWRGTLDGQPVEVLRANYLSQGVVVPEGTHIVELRYEPDAFRYGALISLTGLLGTGVLALWAWRPRLRLGQSGRK